MNSSIKDLQTPLALHPVILCGGSGTRLWPLSRQRFPKQFVNLIEGKNLLHLTLDRIKGLGPFAAPVCLVAGSEHRFLAREPVEASNLQAKLILEPQPRNTAPAIAAAALSALAWSTLQHSHEAPDPLLLILPADNYMPDHKDFHQAVQSGIPIALAEHWVIAGVAPSFPATGYGYIKTGGPIRVGTSLLPDAHPDVHRVERFVEKPDFAEAMSMIEAGSHYWNAGIFLVKASVAIDSLKKYKPGLVEAVKQSLERAQRQDHNDLLLHEDFCQAESISIDYAVLEHHDAIAMVKISGPWSDVGSWTAVADLAPAGDNNHNQLIGQAYALDSKGNYVNAPHRTVALLGIEDSIVIDTADAVLIAHKDRVQQVKDLVASMDAKQVPQTREHRRVNRPWGVYETIDTGDRFLVKRITVNPGAALSLQLHHHRAEHWIVVKGTAKVTRSEEVFLLSENQSTYIPLGVKHRLENPGHIPLEMIEVQSGSYLNEDDIVRFSDRYDS